MRESSDFKTFWIPAFAGMTFLEEALCWKNKPNIPTFHYSNGLSYLRAIFLIRSMALILSVLNLRF